jgi:hypothetical protein
MEDIVRALWLMCPCWNGTCSPGSLACRTIPSSRKSTALYRLCIGLNSPIKHCRLPLGQMMGDGRCSLFFAAPFYRVPLGVLRSVKSQAPNGKSCIGPELSTTGPDLLSHIRVWTRMAGILRHMFCSKQYLFIFQVSCYNYIHDPSA